MFHYTVKSVLLNYCVVFLFCFPLLVYPMLPVSLDCPFLIAPSIFSKRLLIVLCTLIIRDVQLITDPTNSRCDKTSKII